MTLRKSIFWLHLTAGLAAGLIIAIMCFTGAALAFERQIVAWAERDARQIPLPPPGTPRLSLDELREKFAQARPDRHPTAITVSNDPRGAVAFSIGRSVTCYVNPYDGSLRPPASSAVRDFMRQMTEWHRWLARSGDSRATGRAITGACNLAFLFLALSGAILWWPRKWRTKGLKRSLWFLRDTSGRARDWNWHNVIGFWLWPVLIGLTASGAVISYPRAGNLVYRTAGEAPPAPDAPRARNEIPDGVVPPAPDARPLDLESLANLVQKEFPLWETVSIYFGDEAVREDRTSVRPVLITVKTSDAWPRTATSNLYLDPFSGTVLKRESFADLTPGRRARTWLRFLHTGEALGPGGQFIAGLACVGGCLLVYTGFALAWRRFRGERKIPANIEPSVLGKEH